MIAIDPSHLSHNTSVRHPTMHHPEQKGEHFCSEWCTAGHPTGALRDPILKTIYIDLPQTYENITAPILSPLGVPLAVSRWQHTASPWREVRGCNQDDPTTPVYTPIQSLENNMQLRLGATDMLRHGGLSSAAVWRNTPHSITGTPVKFQNDWLTSVLQLAVTRFCDLRR